MGRAAALLATGAAFWLALGAAASVRVPACSLVLRPNDLPGGPYEARSRVEGRSASAEDPLGRSAGLRARLAAWGKRGGCEADLVLPVTAKGLQEGPLEVVSSVTVYRSRAGARAAMAYAGHSLVPTDYSELPVDFGLPGGAREWVRQAGSRFGAMLVYFLLWRDRNVNASIVMVGRVGVVSAASLEPLATPQERRIRAAR